MGTTQAEIRRWLEGARQHGGGTHLIVVCDTFDHDDYPVLVEKGKHVLDVEAEYDGKNMQRVMEVYALHLDLESQLDEQRAFHREYAPGEEPPREDTNPLVLTVLKERKGEPTNIEWSNPVPLSPIDRRRPAPIEIQPLPAPADALFDYPSTDDIAAKLRIPAEFVTGPTGSIDVEAIRKLNLSGPAEGRSERGPLQPKRFEPAGLVSPLTRGEPSSPSTLRRPGEVQKGGPPGESGVTNAVEIERIVFEPSVQLRLAPRAVQRIATLAALHYDSACKSAMRVGGIVYGWHVRVGLMTAEESSIEVTLTRANVDLVCKILETEGMLKDEVEQYGPAFRATLRLLDGERERANG